MGTVAEVMAAGLPGIAAETRTKLDRVIERIGRLDGAVLAYSGGADSTLLLAIGQHVLGDRLVAAVATSQTYPAEELAAARECAQRLGARLEVVGTDELADERFAANPPQRCFFCKTELFEKLESVRVRQGVAAILDGTNADDVSDHRPGREAALEAGVISPLLEAGLTKDEVRRLSRALGLSTADKPALACLASRIPYGTRITRERLSSIGQAERAIRALGLAQVRVRLHGDVARVEVGAEQLGRALEARDAIVEACEAAGFTYVALDLVGYRTGSMNETVGPGGPDGPAADTSTGAGRANRSRGGKEV